MPKPAYVYSISPRGKGLTAEEYLLRQSGDWNGYVILMNGGAIEPSPFFRAMMNYYASGIKSFSGVKPISDGILLATSVWGSEYLGRFLTLCLPSLLERDNLNALRRKKSRIFIHTDTAGRDVISNHPMIKALIDRGVMVQMMLLSDDVLEMLPSMPHSKYWHLGMTQSMHLQYAKALNIDYHLMMPDFVYSAGYFERLFALDKPIITHGCISSDQATMPFDDFRDGIALSVPASKLSTLSLRHLHPRAEYHFVKDGKYPAVHLLVFEGKNEISIMSPHQTIAYLSKEIISQISNRIFFTLDSELDKVVGDNSIYTPSAKDALVVSEVSGKAEIYARKEVQTAEEYCQIFRQRAPEEPLYKLFLQDMSFPIERTMIPEREYMLDENIIQMKQEIKKHLCPENPR